MGPSGPVALNMLAIELVLDQLSVEKIERRDLHQLVQSLAGSLLKKQYEVAEAKRKK